MREIEFRAWDKKYECMDDYGFYIRSDGRVFEPASTIYNTPNTQIEEVKDRYILMQYTGLKDKNGNKIFEGDILKGVNGSINGEPWKFGPYIIEYEHEKSGFNVPFWGTEEDYDGTHWFEVVGNIHDNPEMVKA